MLRSKLDRNSPVTAERRVGSRILRICSSSEILGLVAGTGAGLGTALGCFSIGLLADLLGLACLRRFLFFMGWLGWG